MKAFWRRLLLFSSSLEPSALERDIVKMQASSVEAERRPMGK